jgi:rifampicin phosphotransferase
MTEVLTLSQIADGQLDLVGGKGYGLAQTMRAGLPVPDGFVVTAEAFRRSQPQIDDTLWQQIVQAYRDLGMGPVAVRSSALGEDGAETSYAGQQETILGIVGEEALKRGIERCWASLRTERAKAYREQLGVDESNLAMAVVVQRLIDADVAGVLFTIDPIDAGERSMRVEASWGLGESVVSGRVTPDRFQVDRESGNVLSREPGLKTHRVTRHGEQDVPADEQKRLCLSDDDLRRLAELGRRVEAYYRAPRDIEWALADDQLWLLQARPITTTTAKERDDVRQATIARLSAIPEATAWSKTNLIEVLSEPTPMTWSIVSRNLLSGTGGVGGMYRDFGFTPDPKLGDRCAYDLIGGRPYLNLQREPYLQSPRPVYGYPVEKYRTRPLDALQPKIDSSKMLGGLATWLRLPGILLKAIATAGKVTSALKAFPEEFRSTILPAFRDEMQKAESENLRSVTPEHLRQRLESLIRKTHVDFARQSLKPTLLAECAWQMIEPQFAKKLGAERAKAIVGELSLGVAADDGGNLAGAFRALAAGMMTQAQFLADFGHRGPNEMELSAPRWREGGREGGISFPANVGEISEVVHRDWTNTFDGCIAAAGIRGPIVKSLRTWTEQMRTCLGLRETAKHHLMRGHAEIRRTLLELDRRFGLHNGIFFLEPAELEELIGGRHFHKVIGERRKQRAVELSLEIPPVLFRDTLDVIGQPIPRPEGATEYAGIPLSAGVAEGPALVLTQPQSPNGGIGETNYLLVCPTTDPAWVPLFVHAKGLIMESGGTLSHGAIVAREFGLPAVAGFPGITQILKTGQRLRIDGARGTLTVLDG